MACLFSNSLFFPTVPGRPVLNLHRSTDRVLEQWSTASLIGKACIYGGLVYGLSPADRRKIEVTNQDPMEIEQPQNYCAFVKETPSSSISLAQPLFLFSCTYVFHAYSHTDTVKFTKHVVDHLSVFSTAMIFVLDRKVKGKGK